MTVVKIIKNWDEPDLLRQTPGQRGIWDDIYFTLDPHAACDYLLVLNFIPSELGEVSLAQPTWAMMQEPHIAGKFDWVVEGHDHFDRVLTHCINNKSEKYRFTQTCLPWHVNKSYDELSVQACPAKPKTLSWITSNKRTFPGHKLRMDFHLAIATHNEFEIDVFGYGINPIEDKWLGLSPYKYSLAVENSSSPHYWTEKLADCFLSYSLPFYYGCTNLEDYFPEEAFIRIDINNPKHSMRLIEDAINSRQWEKRQAAIAEARDLVLNHYQLFPFIAKEIRQLRS